MGQSSSVDSPTTPSARSRASTMRLGSVAQNEFKTPRMSLPDYTLTQYDVKQLMKSYNQALDRRDTEATCTAENEAEVEIMEQIHGQFGTRPRSRSVLKSTTSNASRDSGIDDTTQSPRHSVDDLSSSPVFEVAVGENTPLACTPATPAIIPELIFTLPIVEIPLDDVTETTQTKRRFLPKRLFSKKKRAQDRKRSKSVGADMFVARGDRTTPLFGSSLLNREWELVTVREMCRRLSLDEVEQLEMPIPEGASQSQILDELMIRQVRDKIFLSAC
ncbi:hypothetical protein ANCDUO_06857 [Ancylostoma duodenale]|uniref:Uncharacterized protein n=1 Tax=Ancylostoma duodenale TaxID=51022 RepID=A0A0C2H0M1_9BILA|nr:hypothetical protein ANCDUO_06857 [Ancylostoma duodenale]